MTPAEDASHEIVDDGCNAHPTFSDKTSEQVYAFKLLMTETDKIKDPEMRNLGADMMRVLIRVVGGEKTTSLRAVKT